MDWQKSAPDTPGYWIRLNAKHEPQIHQVSRIDDDLVIVWGHGGDEATSRICDVKHKLEKFWWTPVFIPEK